MSRIFLCHIEKDLPFMQQIAQGLEAAGYSTWYFERDVLPGTSYLIHVMQGIENCDAIVLIISPNALGSSQVSKEVVSAFERDLPFFPVLVGMTSTEFKEYKPEWRHALSGTAMIMVVPEGIPSAIPHIVDGLKAKGILPAILSTPKTSAPKHVVERVLATRSSMEGERKQVTILFADVKGFTTLSENLDPEEVHDLIRQCIEFMTEEIHRYEGTIAQFLGDGLMALFGAPIAHEDAPQRALYAALAIQRHLKDYAEELKVKGIELAMRIGINTGLVIVGRIGDDLTMEYTAIGDTVNLASRMESTAQPGTIQVAENTYHLTEGYFDFEELGETQVKGKEVPVKSFRVLKPRPARTRIEASLEKGLTPFIGRNREREHLMECFEKVKEDYGQVVGVVGEPGVGKSRLIREFIQALPNEEITYLEGWCLHYGEAIAYLPILDILRDYFGIHEDENEITIKQKISIRLNQFQGLSNTILSPLHEILSLLVDDEEYIRLEPKQRRERVFEAIRLLLVSESQKKPLVVVLDDLHWIDKTSEEFFTYLVSSLATTRIMLILLYRPEYTPAWISRTYFNQIRVDQLSKKTSVDLVQSILAEGEVEPGLSELIVSRASGNPLFMEEICHSLEENGSIQKADNRYALSLKPSEIKIPDTIQGIIAARMDRLDENLKRIMQVASVIGREFAFRILQAVANLREDLKSSLLSLQDLEFIYEKALFPELEYIFKHALTQEVAYNSLLLKRRRETHERVGQAIEQIYKDRLEDFYEVLAHHYSLSENPQKAYQYLKLSGDKATKNYSNWEAIRFYKEAIRVLDTQQDTEEIKKKKIDLFLSIMAPMFILGYPEDPLRIYQEAERLSLELGDEKSLTRAYRALSFYHSHKGNVLLGIEYAEKCFDQAEKIKAIDLMAQSADQVSASYYLAGDFIKVIDITRRALQQIEEYHREKDFFEGGMNVYTALSGNCGGALGFLGKFEEGKAVLNKGLQNAREVNDRFGIGWSEISNSLLSFSEGDGRNTVDHARTSIKYFKDVGAEYFLGFIEAAVGTGYYLLGDNEQARDHGEKGLKLQEKHGIPVVQPFICWFLAIIYLALGDLEQAKECAEESMKLSQEFKMISCEGLAWITLGSIKGKSDLAHLDEAQHHIRQGISIQEKLKVKAWSTLGYLFLGELFSDAGRKKEAMENLKKAEALYLEMKVTPKSYWLKHTQEALAKLGQ